MRKSFIRYLTPVRTWPVFPSCAECWTCTGSSTHSWLLVNHQCHVPTHTLILSPFRITPGNHAEACKLLIQGSSGPKPQYLWALETAAQVTCLVSPRHTHFEDELRLLSSWARDKRKTCFSPIPAAKSHPPPTQPGPTFCCSPVSLPVLHLGVKPH